MKGKLMKLLRYLLFVIVLLAPSSALAAIGVPSTLGTANTTTSTATSLSVTTTGAIVAGNLVVVAITNFSRNSATVTGVSDGTNTYTQWNLGAVFGTQSFWFKNNATAVSSGATLTITLSGAVGVNSYILAQVAQVSGASTEDTGSENSNIGPGQPTITSNALATANEIVFGLLLGQDDASNTYTYSEMSGWTNLYETVSPSTVGLSPPIWLYPAFSYTIVASSSAVTWAPTFSTTPDEGFINIIGGFEGSVGPATKHFLSLTGVGQ